IWFVRFMIVYWTNDLAQRAAIATIGVMGTSLTSVAVSFLVYPLVEAIKNRSLLRQFKDWRAVRSQLLGSAGVGLCIWSAVFLYELPRPVYSASEISEFANGVVVAVLSPDGRNLIGAGFWIDSRGYMITCLQQPFNSLKVGVIVPPIQTRELLVSSGMLT